MLTEQEPKEYKAKVEQEYGECAIYVVPEDCEMYNCGDTGGRKAPFGFSWTDFWRAMTEHYAQEMHCSSCGKELFAGNGPSLKQYIDSEIDFENLAKHKSHGGHVWLDKPEDTGIEGGRYITPLCPEHNGQHNKHIPIKKGSVLCKEIIAKKED